MSMCLGVSLPCAICPLSGRVHFTDSTKRPTYFGGSHVWNLPTSEEDATHQNYSYVVPTLDLSRNIKTDSTESEVGANLCETGRHGTGLMSFQYYHTCRLSYAAFVNCIKRFNRTKHWVYLLHSTLYQFKKTIVEHLDSMIERLQPFIFTLWMPGRVLVLVELAIHPLTTTPPLGCKHCPDMKLLSWLARNTKQVATSLGCPGRPIGTELNCSMAESNMVEGIRGVKTINPVSSLAFDRVAIVTHLDRDRRS